MNPFIEVTPKSQRVRGLIDVHSSSKTHPRIWLLS
jgi:hypothetical protein